MPVHENLTGRAIELARLTDLIRASLAFADATLPPINEQLAGLAELGVDSLELEGPQLYSRIAGLSPAMDDDRVIYAAALLMPGGLGCTVWSADEYASRYGDSQHEPPDLRERFVAFERLPPIVRAMIPGAAPKLIVDVLQSFTVLNR